MGPKSCRWHIVFLYPAFENSRGSLHSIGHELHYFSTIDKERMDQWPPLFGFLYLFMDECHDCHIFSRLFFPLSFLSFFFFFPFFPFCGFKPYFLLTNDLLSAARRALMLFVLTALFHSSEQSWLSKVLKYVPNFTYTKSESKVSGSHFGTCWSTLLYWVSYVLKTCWCDSTSPSKLLLIVWINLYHR